MFDLRKTLASIFVVLALTWLVLPAFLPERYIGPLWTIMLILVVPLQAYLVGVAVMDMYRAYKKKK